MVAVPPAGGVTLAGVIMQLSGEGYATTVIVTNWLKLPDDVTVRVESPGVPE